MPDDIEPDLSQRISEANQELASAQQELLDILGDIDTKDRADKTIISTVLRDVLDKVTAARRKLVSIDDCG